MKSKILFHQSRNISFPRTQKLIIKSKSLLLLNSLGPAANTPPHLLTHTQNVTTPRHLTHTTHFRTSSHHPSSVNKKTRRSALPPRFAMSRPQGSSPPFVARKRGNPRCGVANFVTTVSIQRMSPAAGQQESCSGCVHSGASIVMHFRYRSSREVWWRLWEFSF
jgi:hypothetical protein